MSKRLTSQLVCEFLIDLTEDQETRWREDQLFEKLKTPGHWYRVLRNCEMVIVVSPSYFLL